VPEIIERSAYTRLTVANRRLGLKHSHGRKLAAGGNYPVKTFKLGARWFVYTAELDAECARAQVA
jgi:hypothetical protein